MSRPPLPLGTWGKISRHELGTDRWQARARYRDYDGTTRTVKANGRTAAAAERALVNALRDRKRQAGDDELGPETTVLQLADAWIKQLRAAGRPAPQSIDKYADQVERRITPALGGVHLREVTTGSVERFLAAVDAPSAHKQCRTILTQMFALAARHDAVAHNPVRDTTVRHVEPAEVVALTGEQVRALRVRVSSWAGGNTMGPPRAPDLVDLFDVQLGAGLRIGEVLALRWEDVDLEAAQLTVTGTVIWRAGQLERKPRPKSRAGFRTVVLPAFTVAALRRQLERGYPSDDALVFPSHRGGLRSPNNVRRQLREAVKGTDFAPILAGSITHVLRKTNATVIEQAYGLDSARAQMGHSSSSVTERHYVRRAKLAPDHRPALEALGPVSAPFPRPADPEEPGKVAG